MAVKPQDLMQPGATDYQYGFHDVEDYKFKSGRGLTREMVAQISEMKNEPEWMREFRLRALEIFKRKPMPTWGADLSEIDFDNIYYYVKPSEKTEKTWDDVPAYIKDTFDKLGIPEAERKFLAGVSAQYESEVVYHNIREDLEKQGVIFLDMDSGLREHPEIVKEYFATVIPAGRQQVRGAEQRRLDRRQLHLRARRASNVEIPLQAYFRINTENMGQFERTLIIADEGSLGPLHRGLHGADLQQRLAALGGGRADRRSGRPHPLHDDPELVEQRLQPGHQARRRLRGRDRGVGRRQPRLQGDDEVPRRLPGRARARRARSSRWRSPARASTRTPAARSSTPRPNTTSTITSKSISKGGGRTSYRGLLKVAQGRRERQVVRALRRAAAGRDLALGHLPVDRDRRGAGRASGTRRRSARSATSSSSICMSRGLERDRGEDDDRQRLLRAVHQGAADGVRRRAEPADRSCRWKARSAERARRANSRDTDEC